MKVCTDVKYWNENFVVLTKFEIPFENLEHVKVENE